MTGVEGVSKQRRFFSLTASTMVILSTMLIGVNLQVPNATAGAITHDVGNLDIETLTDFGRILEAMYWKGIPQTIESDPLFQTGFIGLVIDQDNYDHTAGSEQVADPFKTWPYLVTDDFTMVSDIRWLIDNGTTQKSGSSFHNTGAGTGDPNDIFIEQTAWTVLNKDWAILQWTLINQKAVPLNNVCIGLELPLSQVGALYGVGWDSGDDIDGFDAGNATYWVQDDGGTTIGFASVTSTDPITHYYSEDYQAEFENVSDPFDPDPKYYKNFYADDAWLYNRIHAPNAVEGLTPGNRSSTVGWNGINIGVGSSRTFTLVIAINNSFDNMITALKDARYYYQTVATKIILTEFSDVGGSHRIEVYNDGREPTPGSAIEFSVDGGSTFLTGNWNPDPIPTYEYAVFDVSGGIIGAEGDTIGMYENGKLIEEVAFGLEGIAPDPLPFPLESVARRYTTSTDSYTNDWLRNGSSGSTFGSQNDVGNIISIPIIVINRVMFNPINTQESYVELMYKGLSDTGVNIEGYKIVCNDEFIVPSIPNLNRTNRFFVLTYLDFPAFFNNMNAGGDNVYLYNQIGYLMDMVGWSSPHTPGYYMSRVPDGNGTYQGFNDTTSQAEGWVFDLLPSLMLTEFYADPTNTDVELYNPRGGDKVLDGRWTIQTTGGTITPAWTLGTIPANGGYDYCTSSGPAGAEGDTISLYYNPGSGDILMDEVSYGTFGVAPDPLSGGSTARWWSSSIPGYSDDWTGNIITAPTWGAQNDVPPINKTPWLILDEVMFNPTAPDRGYIVIISLCPMGWSIDPVNFFLVCDDVYQITWSADLSGGNRQILRYNDDLLIQPLFQKMESTGDNVYLYDPSGRLYDMVGWNTPHLPGMSVRRVPDGNGTYQGHDDITSEAASWVFNSPLEILITEISDGAGQIELYNPWYPTVDFGSFTYTNDSGPIVPIWNVQFADAGQYAYFTVDASTPLDIEGDTISFYHNGILIEAIGYGQKGIAPDPLTGESVQRYWDGTLYMYTDVWERNWTTGPNFGFQNNVPPANLSSQIVLNEVLFYPNVATDGFVELYLRSGIVNDISGYKIVGNTEYIIPVGTILSLVEPFFYLMNSMDPSFFGALNPSGDNVYLYDDNGSLLDMAGWSSLHTQGMSMCRIPNGTGTRDGFDDTSSIAAGWIFDTVLTIQLVKVDMSGGDGSNRTGFGKLGEVLYFNLTIWNFQSASDLIIISNSTQEGWLVEILDKSGTIKISDITLGPDESRNIIVRVKIPSTFNFIVEDNITISIQSTNNPMIWDSILLQAKLYPFVKVYKSAFPIDINIEGTGYDEETTITLSALGTGAIIEGPISKAADIVFVVDDTGSMSPYINSIKVEIQNIVQVFQDEIVDLRLGLISYKDFPELDCNLTDNMTQFIDAVNMLIASGGGDWEEDVFGAMDMAINLGWRNESVSKIIILIGDAPDHFPWDDVDFLVRRAHKDEWGIFTNAIACGSDANTIETFTNIADNGSGIFYNYLGFMDPEALAQAIIESVLTFVIKIDIAARDLDIVDSNPMIRDVLPPYIKYVPGSASIPPDMISTDAFGNTILEWNVSIIKIGENWTVSFNVTSSMEGWQLANVVLDSRVSYSMWNSKNTTELFPEVSINVISIPTPPTVPDPPIPILSVIPGTNHMLLEWVPPSDLGIDHYLIYRAVNDSRSFDFSSPWVNTSSDMDPLGSDILGIRTSWNFTDDVINAKEIYYNIRAVNNFSLKSTSSITVGKWTRTFEPGVSTFSIPLETFQVMTADDYLDDMGAKYIKWMDPSTQTWKTHGDGFINNTQLNQGEGYQIKFTNQSTYTFCGMPAAMIRLSTDTYLGFDSAVESDSLFASVNFLGNVSLEWVRPDGMDSNDRYMIYRAITRTGFHDGSAQLIMNLPYGTEFWNDSYAAQPGTQYYYMIIPENETGVNGTGTYSIGVWTQEYLAGYDTIGIPVKMETAQTIDWLCENIPDSVGINYYIFTDQRWGWHSTRMPAGAYDPTLMMAEGYQISTGGITKFTFIGR